MELYDKKISEFVDWVTGEDTSDKAIDKQLGAFSTNGIPSSGKAIRELLQRKLKTPFVVYEDKSAGLYRLFSSEESKSKWLVLMDQSNKEYNPDKASKYELFNFERPSDTALVIGNITSDARYIINGDANSDDTKLQFSVTLKREKAGGVEIDVDGFTVTYTIKDASGVETVISEEFNASDCSTEGNENIITRDMYRYLKEGTNQITLAVKARNTAASNKMNIPFYLVNFELSSAFAFAEGKDPNKAISVPFRVKRSVAKGLTLTVEATIDGNPAYKVDGVSKAEHVTSSTELDFTGTLDIANTYAANVTSQTHIKHLLKLQATMVGNNQKTFVSNAIFFEFEVASSTIGIVNKFVNIKYSVAPNKIELQNSGLVLRGTQYEPFSLDWGYYTDQTTERSIPVTWAIRKPLANGGYTYDTLSIVIGNKGSQSETLRFIPSYPITAEDKSCLVARYNGVDIDAYNIIIDPSTLNVVETSDYNLKLSAYGKSNNSSDKANWVDIANNKRATFSEGVVFDSNNGWKDNSLVLCGEDAYATINYCPFPTGYNLAGKGKTLEIEFKSEKVYDNSDILIRIGGANGAHIDITPNSAALYVGTERVVYTNYKANEKIKLAFIFNVSGLNLPEDGMVYIVNNGILERAALIKNANSCIDNNGNIKLGGSKSGVRVYSMRAYDKAISYNQELNNFIYDSENKAILLSNNDILIDGKISYERCKNKIDTILIEGDLSKILDKGTDKLGSESTADFERICISDATKSFKVKNGKIRKHGQSTLNYPITSYKIWTNKSNSADISPVLTLSDNQKALGLNKNRYIMKTGAIPANKFVLQANYADSSGVHNGGIERLIQDCWYNAEIDGQFRLRTAPQLFTSNKTIAHNDENINETGWVEGQGKDFNGNIGTWSTFSKGKDFPYTIRTAPDSFPCAVFYKNTANPAEADTYTYLGQFVFMDDKKSDFLYGERSIYAFGNYDDPFVMKTENTKNGPNGKQDTKENRVWDNSNVLRIEVVLLNNELTSFMDYNVPATGVIEEDGSVSQSDDNKVPCDAIKYDEKGNPDKFYWEDYFELIYPDPDDVAEDPGMTKFSEGSKFRKKTQPFLDFLKWITDIAKLNSVGNKIGDGHVTQAALDEFKRTAHEHLDLYKVAAYYIFCMRLGMVDSIERNNQFKTYDGQHWHCEPWDIDIAIGNKNTGGNAFDPPMTRDTRLPGDSTTWAFSGRSATTSNVLWDCLEAWDYWSNTLVPKVAQALYEAGLSYDNITKMFDQQYAEKWSELMYNESGYFKYIKSGGKDWLEWLQGARTSHRHWWVSSSMNYYDAKWSCGSFNAHRVYLGVDKIKHPVGTDLVTIKPSADTFFKFTRGDGTVSLGIKEASRERPAVFDVSQETFSVKDPTHIYGATFIEELDVSCFADKISALDVTAAYDETLGAPIKVLDVGTKFTEESETVRKGTVSGTQLRLTDVNANTGNAALENLKELNVRGQYAMLTADAILSASDRKNVSILKAMGTGITAFESAASGNKFDLLELPGITTTNKTNKAMNSFKATNTSWTNLQFWDANINFGQSEDATNSATFTLSTVPSTISTVEFYGSTAQNDCSKQFVLDWISSIEATLPAEHTEQDLYNALSSKQFIAENINWSGQIFYNDLARIAHMNYGNNQAGDNNRSYLRGYVLLADPTPLSAAQLANLRNWFGDSVFDKSAITSGLVVDQNTNYVQIMVGGVEVADNGDLILNEPNAVPNSTGVATLVATKFILGDDTTEYEWSLESNAPYNNNFVELKTDSEDGIVRIIAKQGTFGDYFVNVKAQYTTPTGKLMSNTVRINIHGVTYPESFSMNMAGNATYIRQFVASEDVLASVFGADNIKYNNELIPAYVITTKTPAEFYIEPSSTDYTATINKIEYSYYNYSDKTVSSGFLTREELGVENSQINTIGPSGDDPLAYTKDASHGGMNLQAITITPNPTAYRFIARISIGGKDLVLNYVNLIIWDDATPILSKNAANQLFNAVSNKYATDFNLESAYFDFYKTHLISLTGELSFVGYEDMSSLGTNKGDSIFKYTPNLTSVILDGCTMNFMHDDGVSDGEALDFSVMTKLNTLSMNGCVNTVGTLSITNTNISNIDLRGTNIGIDLPERSKIANLQLGSPVAVKLNSPLKLDTITIESSENIDELSLTQVDLTSNHGFGVFDILMQNV